jgi:hypothetical protein
MPYLSRRSVPSIITWDLYTSNFKQTPIMEPPGHLPAPPSVVADVDFQPAVHSTSVQSPLSDSGPRGTASTSLTESPVPRGALGPPPSASQLADGCVNKKLEVGWPKLAQELAQTPSFEAFPRFRELNVKSLLYYQVELSALEQKLQKIELDDHNHTGRRNRYAASAQQMLFPAESTTDPKATEQRQVLQEIRRLLKEYSKSGK